MSAAPAHPRVAVVVPCFDEAGFVDPLLEHLLPQTSAPVTWTVVLVDDSSTDATPEILAAAAAAHPHVTVVRGRYGSPGAARSAGIAHLLAAPAPTPEWLVTLDADVLLPDDWAARWSATLASVHTDAAVGAVNGVELQEHLYVDHPRAAQVSRAFGIGIVAGESAVGVTNLNGVNHAIRTEAYLTAGPYRQPSAPGPQGVETLAGEDWDLGVRIRCAGYTIAETEAAVIDRGRRLLTDVHAYVSGEAYEGPFRRLAATGPSPDVDPAAVDGLVDRAVDRSLRHFLLKTVLAGAVEPADVRGLRPDTVELMRSWMQRWPHPTFEESRNGFVFGRLARFADAVTAQVRRDLDLGLDSVLARVR